MSRAATIRFILFLTTICSVGAEPSPVARIRMALRDAAIAPETVANLPISGFHTAPAALPPFPQSPVIPALGASSLPVCRTGAVSLPSEAAMVPVLGARGLSRSKAVGTPLRPSAVPDISAASARQRVAALAYDLLQEGKADPRSPEWRPYLAELVARPLPDADPVALYHLFLASFEGIDTRARMTLAESWAARHEGGRYAGPIALASLRSLFQSGDYEEVEKRTVRVAADHPEQAAQSLSLRVLCQVYRNDLDAAEKTVAALRQDFAGTPDEPEILYLAAWLRIEQNRLDEARQMLQNVRNRFPDTSAAKKARSALEELQP